MAKFLRISPGATVGPCTVVGIHTDAETAKSLVYTVTWNCCKRQDQMTHHSLNKRFRDGIQKCVQCARLPAAVDKKVARTEGVWVGKEYWPTLRWDITLGGS